MIKQNPRSDPDKTLSRRQFLQLCGFGAAGLMLPNGLLSISNWVNKEKSDLLGRVTRGEHPLHLRPDSTSRVLEEMDQDWVRSITQVTIGEDPSKINRIWYELGGEGYAHSGRIQPVRHLLNGVRTAIPDGGCLGEITVPFVDAYNTMKANRAIIYRFYYASTFWVLDSVLDELGEVWYELLDDRYYRTFFIPAETMRLVPESELTAISPDVPEEEKKIVIDLAGQTLTAYEGEQVALMSRISSGTRQPEGGFSTPTGYYRTTRKRPCRHMASPPSEFGSGFDLPGVPWVSYFTGSGIAIHGSYWHNDFGIPYSHGCINMTPQAAKWVYLWTTPTVPPENYFYAGDHGTRVIVQ